MAWSSKLPLFLAISINCWVLEALISLMKVSIHGNSLSPLQIVWSSSIFPLSIFISTSLLVTGALHRRNWLSSLEAVIQNIPEDTAERCWRSSFVTLWKASWHNAPCMACWVTTLKLVCCWGGHYHSFVCPSANDMTLSSPRFHVLSFPVMGDELLRLASLHCCYCICTIGTSMILLPGKCSLATSDSAGASCINKAGRREAYLDGICHTRIN